MKLKKLKNWRLCGRIVKIKKFIPRRCREHIIDAEQYKPLYNNLLADPLYHDFFDYTEQNGLHLQLTDGYTSPTDYGRLFFAVCYKKIF